jgi:hypothetical protein
VNGTVPGPYPGTIKLTERAWRHDSSDRTGVVLGYVGRSPGTVEIPDRHPGEEWKLVARPGEVMTDKDAATLAKSLGLADLEDHTDYDQVLADAKAAGALVTVVDPVKVGGRWRVGIKAVPAEGVDQL